MDSLLAAWSESVTTNLTKKQINLYQIFKIALRSL